MRSRLKLSIATTVILAALAMGFAAGVRAHDVEKGPNGGLMVTAGEHHLELVSQGAEIVVFLMDKKHEPVPAKGANGRAIVQAGGKTSTIVLSAGDGNRLVGKAESPLATGARVVVSASVPGAATVQGRFVVK